MMPSRSSPLETGWRVGGPTRRSMPRGGRSNHEGTKSSSASAVGDGDNRRRSHDEKRRLETLSFPHLESRQANQQSHGRRHIHEKQPPKNPANDYVKRVIGIAGDRISVHGHDVSLNGTALGKTDGDGEPYEYEDVSDSSSLPMKMAGRVHAEELDGLRYRVLEMSDRVSQESSSWRSRKARSSFSEITATTASTAATWARFRRRPSAAAPA